MTDRTQMQAEEPMAHPRESILNAPPRQQKWLRAGQLFLAPRRALWITWIDHVLIAHGYTPLGGVRGMSRIAKDAPP